MANKIEKCELCGRDIIYSTKHHLTPKDEGGAKLKTANLCIPCHKQIHALYTNKELAQRLNNIELLREDEKIKRYLKWVKKQSPHTIIKVKKSNNVRKKR